MTEQDPIITPSQPKKRRWWMWLLASPFLLFSLLILLLYLPPVQRFAVDKASSIASESTGLDITVGRLLSLLVSDIYSQREDKRYTFLLAQWSIDYLKDIQVAIAQGFHLFPFRTEKLSLVTPMVLRLWESR